MSESSTSNFSTGSDIRVEYIIDEVLQNVELDIGVQAVWVTEFDSESARTFAQDMHRAHSLHQPVIPVVIDSFGGDVYSVLSMIAEIRAAELPVATIVKGKAMSAGAFLAAAGTPGYRYCDPEATYMIHEVSSMTWGKVSDIRADSVETSRLNSRLFKILADSCKQKPDYFLDIIHEKNHADWFLNPIQAKKHNLVDHIRLPKMTIKVDVDWQFS